MQLSWEPASPNGAGISAYEVAMTDAADAITAAERELQPMASASPTNVDPSSVVSSSFNVARSHITAAGPAVVSAEVAA